MLQQMVYPTFQENLVTTRYDAEKAIANHSSVTCDGLEPLQSSTVATVLWVAVAVEAARQTSYVR
eukprot:scaffold18507_cov49-Attheya_sp.AAC.3